MIERQVSPDKLMAVRCQVHELLAAPRVATFHVLAEAVEDGRRYLNTYTRGGKLRTSRRCTVPIDRDWIIQQGAA